MADKRMRCTNLDCQAAFEVIPEAGGNIASAEHPAESMARTAEPNGDFDWRSAPPPVQTAPIEHTPESPANRAPQDQAEPKSEPLSFQFPSVSPRRSPRRFIVGALSLFVIAATVTGIVMIVRTFTQAEQRLADDANRAYEGGQFGRASEVFGELSTKYANGVQGRNTSSRPRFRECDIAPQWCRPNLSRPWPS